MANRDAGPGPADVCLILEGTYPYVAGGVSGWTHDLLRAQHDLSFHLVALLPQSASRERRYEVPDNVAGITHITIQEMVPGARRVPNMEAFFAALEGPLERLQSEEGGLEEVREILALLQPYRSRLGRRIMLNSPLAWEMLLRMYERGHSESSFLDYFWSWRALLGGMFAMVLAPLPPARVYHTVSTGYAGLYAARAALETGRPSLVTEHGIYTNERRIEIAMADWLFEGEGGGLYVNKARRDLRDLWVDTFASYSRACYGACKQIITLYEGNQLFQLEDGAPPEKLRVIPNGIDFQRYSGIERQAHDPGRDGLPPTVALIGRVVPIKDVKTFIRAAAVMRDEIAGIQVKILGPYDEDEDYYEECLQMVAQNDLGQTVEFTGRVNLNDYLGHIHVIVLTSISEAMPLVILEAGAAGIPTVATDVGACREMILGRSDEDPPLGPAGAVTALSNPRATADACIRLFNDPDWYATCSAAIRARVERYYNKIDQDRTYHDLYLSMMTAETVPSDIGAPVARQAAE